jgi:hypothetical protein
LPAIAQAIRITPSIAGVAIPAAPASADIGISPTGTSSARYLWSQDLGVPVA